MQYPALFPVEAYLTSRSQKEELSILQQQLKTPRDIFSRKNMDGHITASGLILNEAASQILLIGHKGLNKWLQPGGHIDLGDETIWAAAEREIKEETGLGEIKLHPWHSANNYQPLHIDTHSIPARPEKNEGAHHHHDCLYVFVTAEIKFALEDDGITAAKWCESGDPCVPARLKHALTRLQTA